MCGWPPMRTVRVSHSVALDSSVGFGRRSDQTYSLSRDYQEGDIGGCGVTSQGEYQLVDAQQARRVLDRLVSLSHASVVAQGSSTALRGRVQSVAAALLFVRERL